MSETDEKKFRIEKFCHICRSAFDQLNDDPRMKKVRDHQHYGDGHYRGAAHSYCNLRYQTKMMLPIFLHNLSKYDASLFIHELAAYEEDPISVIGLTHETYISFNQKFHVGTSSDGKKVKFELRFLDSYRFLSSSIDTITKTIDKSKMIHTRYEFKSPESFELMSQKGHVCFDYIKNFDTLLENKLPDKKCFASLLTGKNIADKDYDHAIKVFNVKIF